MTENKFLRSMFAALLWLGLAVGILDAQASEWLTTGDLNEARSRHTMTLLPDNQVLAVGGYGAGGTLGSAELYDQETGSWSATGSLLAPRGDHTATLLPNGLVLVAGGSDGTARSGWYQYPGDAASAALATAELYDPATGAWLPTGSLNTPRYGHTATLLDNGWILVSGGCCDSTQGSLTALESAELYDPETETWTLVASMSVARDLHSATLLTDGSVLVAGGQYPYPGNNRSATVESAEIYTFDPADPSAGTWQTTGSMLDGRSWHGAARLPDGTVLVTGGYPGGCCAGLQTAEAYDPDQKTWHNVGAMTDSRFMFTATPLADGTLLATGGYSCCLAPSSVWPSTELYDPATQGWTSEESMATSRYAHAAVLLPDGSVLVAGGVTDPDPTNGSSDYRVTTQAEVFAVSDSPPASQPPTAAFDAVCIGLDCTFADKSTDTDGTINGWSWDFGEGKNSTAQNPRHTYGAAGTYTVSLTVTDDDGATDSVSQDVTVTAGASQPIEKSFVSIATEDGWVRESGENSGVGGRRNTSGSGSKAIRMGDNNGDRQYKSILSFDTSSIPDGATIRGVWLELMRGGNTGNNPFNTHGTSYLDIKTGGFNGSAALQNNDFQAPADAKQVATVTSQGGSGTLYKVDLDAAGGYINKAGRTQLRLYFSLDDNDDRGTDIAGFYSADNSNAARHPRLVVTYEE